MMNKLALQIVSTQRELMGDEASKTFESNGGSIGRSWENDWVLPDPDKFISSHHALISCQNDEFFITDTSSNGVFLDNASEPLGNGNTASLSHVSQFAIGEYLIQLQLNQEQPTEPPADFFSSTSDPFASAAETNNGLMASSNIDATDPLDLLGTSSTHQNAPQTLDLPESLFDDDVLETESQPRPFVNDVFVAPSTHQATDQGSPLDQESSAIPENWDTTSFAPIEPFDLQEPPPAETTRAIEQINETDKEDIPNISEPLDVADTASNETLVAPSFSLNDKLEHDAEEVSPLTASESPDPIAMPQESESPTPPTHVHATSESQQAQETTAKQADQLLADPISSVPNADIKTKKPDNPPPLQSNKDDLVGVSQKLDNPLQLATASFKANGLDPALLEDLYLVDQWLALMPDILSGVLATLQSRSEVKNELRASQTILQPVENNPIKFSINMQDAIHNLFVSQRPGFLKPSDSVKQVFEDITQHEAALITGIQAGLNGLLRRLSPEAIETQINNMESRKNVFGKISPAKKWEYYKEVFQLCMENSSDSFLDMFGEDFVKGYETHISHQKKSDS